MKIIMLVLLGIASSSAAQLLLKKAGQVGLRTLEGSFWIGVSGLNYLLAFVLYAILLKTIPISRLSPLMTVAVMLTVVAGGVLWGEVLTMRLAIGIALGLVAIVFLAF